jgi:hypothetical protein
MIKQFFDDCIAGLKSFYDHYKLCLLFIGGTILALGFHQIVIDLLVKAANRSFKIVNKKADDLSVQESADKESAAKHESTAAAAKSEEDNVVITEDWNKK